MYECTCVYVYMYVWLCMFVCLYVCMFVCLYVCIFVCLYIFITKAANEKQEKFSFLPVRKSKRSEIDFTRIRTCEKVLICTALILANKK